MANRIIDGSEGVETSGGTPAGPSPVPKDVPERDIAIFKSTNVVDEPTGEAF